MSGETSVQLNVGTGGALLGVDLDGNGISWQIVKIGFSLPGVTPVEVSTGTPLPVTAVVTGTSAVKPDGTVWTLTATSANVNVTNASLAVTGAFFQATQPVSIAASVAVTGTFFQATQPVSIATAPVLVAGAAIIGKVGIDQTTPGTTNLVSIGTNGTVSIAAAQTIAVTQATAANLNATVVGTTLTKGTQGAAGFTVQELKDAGRNQTNYFMAAQVVSTATETLQSLTGYKSGALVAATATPAVVTVGKTYRIQRITMTSIAATAIGAIQVQLRANTGGVVAITSPVVDSWVLGGTTSTFVAGDTETVNIDIPDGMEFAAGTGIGITVLGIAPGGGAQAGNFAKVSVVGFEY